MKITDEFRRVLDRCKAGLKEAIDDAKNYTELITVCAQFIDDSMPRLLESQAAFNEGKKIAIEKTIQEYLSKAGKKGGEKSKKNQPILRAMMQYLQKYPNLEVMSNNQISNNFKRKVNENDPITLNFDKCQWDVYYYYDDDNDSEYICAKPCEEYGEKTHKERLIKMSTARNHYIPEAKSLIKKQKNKNK